MDSQLGPCLCLRLSTYIRVKVEVIQSILVIRVPFQAFVTVTLIPYSRRSSKREEKMSRSNGRLEPEVIVNVRNLCFFPTKHINFIHQYADGFAYSKHKMEEAFRPGGFLDKPPAKSPHCAPTATKDAALPPPKREDVDLIVRHPIS